MSATLDDPILLPAPRCLARHPGSCSNVVVTARIDSSIDHFQGYRLSISPDGIHIVGNDDAGIFYARQTLAQLTRQYGTHLPCLEIEDYPDFPVRGVMLDISRDKVPTMATLYSLIDMLAEWKVNQLQLYIEHTFAYRDHPEVWKDASPLTGEEVRALDAYCRDRFIDLVPNQNSFGHMERWLKHPKYLPLAEAPNGAPTPWDFFWEGPFSLCPTDERSVELLGGLYAELLPNFRSGLFNVGCDETFDIGLGRSGDERGKRGATRVYLDFLHRVHELVKSHGRRMMFWGDIIVKEPELISELPSDVIALEWGYEADHPFDADGAMFAKAGVPFYVCPGTSSWCSIAGRTDNMRANLLSAAEAGLKHGAVGYLNTDWGDYGHLQYLPISYAGFAAGAAFSWCIESNRDIPLADVLNRHAFFDSADVMGQLALDLGNVYQAVGKLVPNGTVLFRILVPPLSKKDPLEGVTLEDLSAAEAAIEAAMAPIDRAAMQRADADLIRDEFRNAAAMLRYACREGRWRLGSIEELGLDTQLDEIRAEHQRLWRARNREGGLADSCERLTKPAM